MGIANSRMNFVVVLLPLPAGVYAVFPFANLELLLRLRCVPNGKSVVVVLRCGCRCDPSLSLQSDPLLLTLTRHASVASRHVA